MGVSTHIMLPNDVRIRDVANVIGILAGLPVETVYIKESNTPYAKVDGVKFESSNSFPEMVVIILKGKMIDREEHHHIYYHFENAGEGVLLNPPSTEFWIAIGTGLCKFFGGKIDYSDCDEGKWNKTFKKPRKSNSPERDEPWRKFEKAILDLKPLTIEDLLKVRKNAAYKKIDLTDKKE